MASKSKTEAEKAASQLDLGEQLDELALKMERLKVLYEQYFMGIEKIEPLVARKDVTRSMLHHQQAYIRNTGLRFRFTMMLQRWNIYITYWNRILREIEAGTYTKHLAKIKRAGGERAVPAEMQRAAKIKAPEPDDLDFLESPDTQKHQRPEIPAAPTVAPQPRAPAPTSPPLPGMSADELRELYRKYSDARKKNGEPPVRFETLVTSIEKQAPALLKQHKSFSFDVAVQNGKVILKALPKK